LRLFDRMLSLVRFPLLIVILVLLAPQTIIAGVPIQNTLTGLQGDGRQVNQAKVQANIAEIPLSFIANAGQADANVQFMVKAGKHIVFFTSQEVVFAASEQTEDELTRSSVVRLRFAGANEEVKVEGEEPLPGVANFFLGNAPEQWRANVPTYAAITYQGLYPGIDLVYSGKQGCLKSEFVVAAGADPNAITMTYSGTSSTYVQEDESLVLETPIGKLVEKPPVIYQMIDEECVTVEGGYRLLGNGKVAFSLGDYVPTEPLIIDPTLIYSTYLGATNDDRVRGIAVDGSGNAYIIGETYCGDFPTQDPLQPNCSGNYDAFVAKLNPSGSALVYSTYLGGSDTDSGLGIKVDSSGNAYITGVTYSINFPTQNPVQPVFGGYCDAFVVKLNASGSALVYSTYLGGSSDDQAHGWGIAVDSSGNAYITGATCSDDFPIQNPVQPVFGGTYDAFVAKLNTSGSALVYSTYLGGSDTDRGEGIAVDSSGNAYITGTTWSIDFPTQDPLQPNRGASFSAFVAKLNPSGSALIYSTYLGGSDSDSGKGIAVDSSGNAYITGTTWSIDFPTQDPLQSDCGGYNDAFVAKLNPLGSALVYSTYLGGSDSDGGTGIAVDTSGNAYITGTTRSADFPTWNPLQPDYSASYDAFVAKIGEADGQVVSFPDPNLEQAIRDVIGKPTGDIYDSDLVGLTELDASERGIANLEGIQHCVNLTRLFLQENENVDITPLVGLTNLAVLHLNNNQIVNISALSILTNLTQLRLDNNQITDINALSGLTNLTWLELGSFDGGNQLVDINPLSGLTNLATLYLANNQIVDISSLSGLTNLAHLHLDNNQIVDISPLSGLTNLTMLGLWRNEIVDLSPLTGLTNLRGLYIHTNQIVDLSPLSLLTNLVQLNLHSNEITDISPLAGLQKLEWLRLGNNSISDMAPLANLTNLDMLTIGLNHIDDVSALRNLHKLEELGIYSNNIVDISPLASLTSLTWLNLYNNQIIDIAPLVSNAGIDSGDDVDVRWNHLTMVPGSADMQNIQALIARGVDVEYEPQDTPENQPPDTKIETAKIDQDKRTATFTWSGSDDTTTTTALTYSYRLVRPGPAYDAWSSWSSGKTKKYTDLSPGNYKFQVRARDADGLIDPSPASKEFVIEETENHSPIVRASDINGQPKDMYPDTVYTVTAKYFDPDGRDDLKYCYLRLTHPTKPLTMMWYQADSHAAPWAGEEGENYLSDVNVTSTDITDSNGNEGYELTWSFQINDHWPEVEDAINFGVFALDDGDLTNGWDYADSNASFLRDADPPALIEGFTASDGKDTQCTLHWMNPPDTDLAEVVVRRKISGYPTNHQDGLLLVRRTSPTPGSEGRYPDTDVTNDTTYHYAVFSCDAAGNWNETVVEGKNADIGYPTRSLAVPYYNQSDTNWCWAASSAMLLKYYGFDTESWEIAGVLDAGPDEMALDLRVYNYLEQHFDGALQDDWAFDWFEVGISDTKEAIISALSKGSPVYFGLKARDKPLTEGHVIVIVDWDGQDWDDEVYFHDPSNYLEVGEIHATLTWRELFDKISFTSLHVQLLYNLIFARPNAFSAEGKPLTISVLGTTQDDQFFVVGRGEALHFRWDGRWDYGYHYSGGSDVEIETFPKDPQLDFAVILDSKLYLNVYIANSAPYPLTPTVQFRVYRQRENSNREEITPAPIIRALGPLEGYHTYNSVSVLNGASLHELSVTEPGTYILSLSVIDPVSHGLYDTCEILLRVATLTPAGQNIKTASSDEDVLVTFGNVDVAGYTNIVESDTTGHETGNIQVLDQAYSIDTTVTFTGGVTISIHYDDSGLTPAQEKNLRMYKVVDIPWWKWWGDQIDITQSVDTVANVITGRTDTLSTFLVPLANRCRKGVAG